jgi:hypothetical protein
LIRAGSAVRTATSHFFFSRQKIKYRATACLNIASSTSC